VSATSQTATAPGSGRVLSIDLLRGADVLLMLFVNEIAGVRGAPGFLLHTPHGGDAMTITDVVFPAFVFITGMSIPFALGGRLRKGQPRSEVWRHVLTRTLALLVMGVLMVNVEQARGGGVLGIDLWNVLMTVSVVLVWQAPLGEAGRRWAARLRAAGIALLVVLVFLYRTEGTTGLVQLRPHWWGILGLIGWAYLVAAGLYLVVGERLAVHVGLVGLLYCLYLADEAGQVTALAAVRPYLPVGQDLGSLAAVALSGTVLGLMLVRHRREGASPRAFVLPALGYAAGLEAAGLLLHAPHALHPAFTIDKPLATLPWCLLSSALTAAAWVVVFFVADVKGWRRWPRIFTIGGENALLAYFMAPFFLSLFALSAPVFGGTNPYGALGEHAAIGVVRSAVFAWAVVRLCGWMRARGLRLHI
jgi:heparan-alpha-glucosaminide N-acetyltransferase